MSMIKRLITSDYVNIVVGDRLPQHYHPEDAVQLAQALAADILTVGDSRECLPDGEATDWYLGELDSNLDAVHAADGFLIVGVDIATAENIPWSVFDGDGIVVTNRSYFVYNDAVDDIPFNFWEPDADASRLELLATNATKLATSPKPSTVYSNQDKHPDPPTEPNSKIGIADEVRKCKVCHTLSNNKMEVGNGRAVEWRCPAIAHRNHGRLEALLERQDCLERRERLYDETTERGQRALERVENRREQLGDHIGELREWFDGRFDDVIASDPDLSTVKKFEP